MQIVIGIIVTIVKLAISQTQFASETVDVPCGRPMNYNLIVV